MGCRILHDRREGLASFYDSVTDTAFGPVAYRGDVTGVEADELLESYERWLGEDPRGMSPELLRAMYDDWLALTEHAAALVPT